MRIAFYILGCLLFFGGCLFAAQPKDWLSSAFDRSHNIMPDPYAVDAEADDLFNSTIEIGSGDGDSIFVRFTRFLLRATVVLAVPMILYSAIRISMSFGDSTKLNETLQHLGYVAGGLMLALLSVMIIYLITSLTRSSVDSFIFSFIHVLSI